MLAIQRLWRDYANKEVHSIFVLLEQELYMDKLHELQREFERELNHYEWTNLHRNGLVGMRRLTVGRRRFEPDEEKLADIVSAVIDGVLISNSSVAPKPLVIMGKNKASYV